jgi:hypothetical protein
MERCCGTCAFSEDDGKRVDISSLDISKEDIEKGYQAVAARGDRVLVCFGSPYKTQWATDPRFGDQRIGEVEPRFMNRVLGHWKPCAMYQPGEKKKAWRRLEDIVTSPNGREVPVLGLEGVPLKRGDCIKLRMLFDGVAAIEIADPRLGSARGGRLYCPGCDGAGLAIELRPGLEARWVYQWEDVERWQQASR